MEKLLNQFFGLFTDKEIFVLSLGFAIGTFVSIIGNNLKSSLRENIRSTLREERKSDENLMEFLMEKSLYQKPSPFLKNNIIGEEFPFPDRVRRRNSISEKIEELSDRIGKLEKKLSAKEAPDANFNKSDTKENIPPTPIEWVKNKGS